MILQAIYTILRPRLFFRLWSHRSEETGIYKLTDTELYKYSINYIEFKTKNTDAINTYEPPHDKTNKMTVRPAKTQISLGICPVWSQSLLCAQWVAKDPGFLHVNSEDSDQTGWMSRLIWVCAGCTDYFGFVMRRLISWKWPVFQQMVFSIPKTCSIMVNIYKMLFS